MVRLVGAQQPDRIERGTGYAPGEVVTLFQPTSTLVNQGHAPTLIVESTSTIGAVTAFDWLDYGSLNALPAVPTTLSAYSTTGTGVNFAISPVGWTEGPFATTIASVGTVGTITNITLRRPAAGSLSLRLHTDNPVLLLRRR